MSEIKNDGETHMDYEPTLMYGKYSEELGKLAKSHASHLKHEKTKMLQAPLAVSHTNRDVLKSCQRCYVTFKNCFLYYIELEWVFLLLLGITMALLSFAMDYTIQKCQKAHYWLYKELENFVAFQYLAWVCFPLVFIAFSVGFVHIVSPQAVGSGIPEMKTILRGVVLHEYLTFRVLLAKMIGLTSSLGSRLPIGKEGPFVHIASICATLLNKVFVRLPNSFENDSRQYEILAAACAVGVACNFAAPIGGVLFSIEVTATYFAVRNYWRGFFSAVCGALAFRLLAVWNEEEETITALFKTNFRVEFPFDLQELIAFGTIGIVCGFASALFVYIHRGIVNFSRKHIRVKLFLQKNRFIFPLLVSLVISSLTYPRGFGQFMAGELTLTEALDTLFDNKTWAKLGYIDESVLSDVQQGWKHPSVNIFVTLVLFIVVHFCMTAVAITLAIPAGVFMPVFLIGAAFGRLVGESVAALYPDGFYSGNNVFRIVPGGYAVVGAASLAGGVTHTISTSVIVFELTGQISHILPVMIAVLISNAIAQSLQPSIYDSIIQIKGLPYLPDIIPGKRKLYETVVQDFMVKSIQFVAYTSSFKDLQCLLQTSKLKTFPLVDSSTSMILIGSIKHASLQSLLDKRFKEIKEESDKHTTKTTVLKNEKRHSAGADLQDLGNRAECSMSHDAYANELLKEQVNFDSCPIDPAPFQLVEHTSLHKVHSLFSMLGLNQAYVTSTGKLVGVVSLKELRKVIQGETTTKTQTVKNTFHVGYDCTSQELVSLTYNEDKDVHESE
uniref:Chloride channel protein n=1 Tax=Phallusia mammillata TaxID=59560 RepID=A0A6F9D9B0_9ASCI|nr:chloride channel protein 2-like [Phallusia mammillata]